MLKSFVIILPLVDNTSTFETAFNSVVIDGLDVTEIPFADVFWI